MNTSWIQKFAFGAAIGVGLMIAVPAKAVEPVKETERLEALAKSADTAAEHAYVAKQYRLRSEALEAKAVEHEKKAAGLKAAPRSPMAHKWPAMSAKPWEKEQKLAMQSRRASQEALILANRHIRLSVETQAAE